MIVSRAIGGLALSPPRGVWTALPPPPPLVDWLVMAALVLQLTVSSNLLTMVGIAYNTDGGNPLVKFHVSTYLVVLALVVRLCAAGPPMRSLEHLIRRSPGVGWFIVTTFVCIGFLVAGSSITGIAVYIESYLSAGLLFLLLADMPASRLRLLGWVMLLLFVGNALLAVGETMVHRTLLPIYLGGKLWTDIAAEFRGLALYSHALTGGMMTEMGVFLLIAMRLRARLAVPFGLALLLGLISFGGRTSLLVCVGTVLALGTLSIVSGLLNRTIRPAAIIAALVGVTIVALLLWYLITDTSLGARLAGKMSFNDNSTAVRSYQWLVPGLLTRNELLFGLAPGHEEFYIFQLNLDYNIGIVENFWLVAFLSVGAVGFLFYLTGFIAFLATLWKSAPVYGRAILVTTIIVASTSNSIGKKSNVLFVMTAAVMVTTAFARPRTASAAVAGAQARPGVHMGSPAPGRALRPLAALGPAESVRDAASPHHPIGASAMVRAGQMPASNDSGRALRALRPVVGRA